MITIIRESHGSTFDTEKKVSSGWFDVDLSPLGEQQAVEMGKRYPNDSFSAIFCSDLKRAYRTAEVAFGNRFPIIRDKRLRECNYGDFTHHPRTVVDSERPKRISVVFPNGESYYQVMERVKSFLQDLLDNRNGEKVMVIGHGAARYGLEYWINKVPLEKQMSAPWKWQPGWTYYLERIDPVEQ